MLRKWCVFILTIFINLACLHGMELKRVIVSTNNNPMYIEFWPLVACLWESMGFKPTLVLIADEHCPIDASVGDVLRFDPIPGVSEALQAQAARLFIPALFPDDVCLVSDIDMLPISAAYFKEGARHCPDDGFLVYRDGAEGYVNVRFPMCYVAAKGCVFAAIFKIGSPEDIATRLKEWADLQLGWNTDEIMLYNCALNWEREGGRLIRLGHGVQGRLDRAAWERIDFHALNLQDCIDCHCPRPYSAYRESIDLVAGAIRQNLECLEQSP